MILGKGTCSQRTFFKSRPVFRRRKTVEFSSQTSTSDHRSHFRAYPSVTEPQVRTCRFTLFLHPGAFRSHVTNSWNCWLASRILFAQTIDRPTNSHRAEFRLEPAGIRLSSDFSIFSCVDSPYVDSRNDSSLELLCRFPVMARDVKIM